MIIGLTGGIGSGKSTVAKMFNEFSTVAIYIADIEAKQLMNTSKVIKENLIKSFGEDVFKNAVLNREFLANIVFKDKEKLKVLNNIVHPEVKNHFKKFVANNSDKDYIVYESAILFENNTQNQFDFIITVYTDLEERINRIIKRDNTTRKEVLNRINSQWKDNKKMLLSNYVVDNYSVKNTKILVEQIHNILTKKQCSI
ncbi:dephospho-CoA kinase [Polaribacter sp.]|uniref:dephospho-CoA kinase n=1 Tax=Polaribacter sp. TaxID=1920175 RepID=UPI0035C78F5C